MLKGVEVAPYWQRTKLSQGKREWLDERSFLRENSPRPNSQERRIATQRITGVDERLRVVATIIEPPCYFADSTNSIVLTPEGKAVGMSLEYLLAILNSALIQWRFKLTSTNNNVGTNELDSLPVWVPDFSEPIDVERHSRLSASVLKMMQLCAEQRVAATPHDRVAVGRQISALEADIGEQVLQLYEVSARERETIRQLAGGVGGDPIARGLDAMPFGNSASKSHTI